MKSSLRHFLSIGMVIWAAGILALYFLVHKPFQPAQSALLISTITNLALSVSLVCLAGGFGKFLLRNLEPLHLQEQAAIQLALGLGGLSLVILLLGVLGGLNIVTAWGGLLLGMALLHKQIFSWLAQLWRGQQDWAELPVLEKIACGFVLFLLLLNLSLALAPPLKWDSLAYHLELPKRYANLGSIRFLADNLYSAFPQTAEMWFSWAMVLPGGWQKGWAAAAQGGSLAAAFGWGVGVVALLGIGGFSQRINRGSGLWLAPAILLSGYSISQALHWAYVDLWVMLYGLTVWISIEQYSSNGAKKWLWLAGVEIGFAMGVKYSAGMILPLAGLLLFLPNQRASLLASDQDTGEWESAASVRWRVTRFWLAARIQELVVLVGLVILVVSPWLIKNWLTTGQPLFPSVTSQFPASPWMQSFSSDPLPERSFWNDLFLPLEVPLLGIEGAQISGKPEYGASLGPLMLVLLPALILGWRELDRARKRALGRFLIAAAAGWWLWAALAHLAMELIWPRHYFGIFPLLAVLAVAGYQAAVHARLPGVRIQRILAALIVLTFVLSGIFESQMWLEKDPLKTLFGMEQPEAYLARNLGDHYSAIQAVNQLPQAARVLFLWEPRTFYCHTTCLMDGTLDTWRYLRLVGGTAAGISKQVCAHGVSHVLFYRTGAEWMQANPSLYKPDDWQILSDFLEELGPPLQKIGSAYELYTLDGCRE